MSIYVGKRAQIQNQKLRNLLRSKCMHDGNFPTTLRQPLVSDYFIMNIFLLGDKRHLAEWKNREQPEWFL